MDFLNIEAGQYYLRVVFDSNGNKKYDTGSYLKKIQPERVSFREYSPDDDIRAGWDQVWEFTLLD